MASGTPPIVDLLGEKVKSKDGEVDVASFAGEGKVLALYFSAHWCPPCRAFTPQLKSWYEKFKKGANGDKFDMVFVSSDRDEGKFDEYFSEMPWHALPYSQRKEKEKLSRKFKVSGIPTLVFLNAQSGDLITAEGRSIVMEDEEGKDFPWLPKPFSEIILGDFVDRENKIKKWEDVQGSCLGVYFSAHWCGPCRAFTPNLVKTYNKIKEDGKKFEIIFVSSDNDEGQWKDYLNTMPWLALPFGDSRKKPLSRLFDVSGIPTLVILDENGKVITVNGRGAVTMDQDGKEFPWHPKPVNPLTGSTVSDINDSAALVWFAGSSQEDLDKARDTLNPLAKDYISKCKADNTEPELIFYYASEEDDDDIVDSLRQFSGLKEDVKLAILDIPNESVYVPDDPKEEVTEEVVKKFIDGYVGKTLEARKLRQ